MIFLGVMYLMFTCAINVGGLLQEWFEHASELVFIAGAQHMLAAMGVAPWLTTLLAEGIGRGISITLTFTPVLAAMFFCLGILESSGYMTRAAFIVDRLMSYLGLSGKSFVPMIVGFGWQRASSDGGAYFKHAKRTYFNDHDDAVYVV